MPEGWLYPCVLLPLDSPTVSQIRVLHLPHGRQRVLIPGAGRVGTGGWVYRVGTGWVGTGGVIPVPSHAARGGLITSEAGSGSPCRGLEWVGYEAGRPCTSAPTPAGPGRVLGPSLVLLEQTPPPGQ